ncbi:MAG: SpoIID/LytB domain-containing protein [Marmoricola sp.]
MPFRNSAPGPGPAPRRLRRVLGLLAAVALTAPVLLVGTASGADAARAADTFPVPASGMFTITGNGFGHGRGMSQYGADGAAQEGLDWRQIMAFYYPGTTVSTSRARIAVWLTGDTTRDLKVRAESGLLAVDRGTGTAYPVPDRPHATRWRFIVRSGRTVLQYRTHGWHDQRLGGRHYLRGDGEFRSRDHVLTLITPSGARDYRGALRSARPTAESRDRHTVNVLGLDAYLRGVVPAEMPTSWEPEAVRAQAVAARSYALAQRESHRGSWFQIGDTTSWQMYGGVQSETAGGDSAVRETAGRYLAYAGHPAFTEFSASNGGQSVAGDVPYLVAQDDPYDRSAATRYHHWTVPADAAALERRYPRLGTLETIAVTKREGAGEWGGWVDTVRLDGTGGSVTISGDDLRSVYHLRSRWFTLGA